MATLDELYNSRLSDIGKRYGTDSSQYAKAQELRDAERAKAAADPAFRLLNSNSQFQSLNDQIVGRGELDKYHRELMNESNAQSGQREYEKHYKRDSGIDKYWQDQQAYYRGLGNNDPVIQNLSQRALGQNSIVDRQGQVQQQALANQIAAQTAAAQRGGYNPALARAAMMQQSALGQNMAGQIAVGKAQEQQAAQDAYRQWMLQKEGLASGMYGYGLGDKEAERAALMGSINQRYNYDAQQQQMANQMKIAEMQNDFTLKDALGTALGGGTGLLTAWGSLRGKK